MRQFHEIFQGREDAYGQYRLPKAFRLGGDKVEGQGKTVREPLTQEQYKAHLRGEVGLGLVPVRSDGTVMFFALDVDKYDVDSGLHEALESRVQKLELPLVVVRTKSGGAHLYCFLTQPMDASAAVEYMVRWKKLLGFGAKDRKVEMFPKQNNVRDMDVGSWINLPYFGGENPVDNRVAYASDGKTTGLDGFLNMVRAREIDPADLEHVGKEPDEIAPLEAGGKPVPKDYAQAPPCVQTMVTDGVRSGGRNNALYQFAVFHKKKGSDDWGNAVRQLNAGGEVFDDPVSFKEVEDTIRSVGRSNAQYLCEQQPMCGICDKKTCLTRQFGIGKNTGTTLNPIDRLVWVQSDEPYYVVTVRGQSLTMEFEELVSPIKFRNKIGKHLNIVLRMPKADEWQEIVNEMMQDNCEIRKSYEVSGLVSLVQTDFEDWTAQHCPTSTKIERVLNGVPAFVGGKIYFRIKDFLDVLRKKGRTIAKSELTELLQSLGCEEDRVNVGGRETTLLSVDCPDPWFRTPDRKEWKL